MVSVETSLVDREYFRPQFMSFWKWSDDLSVIKIDKLDVSIDIEELKFYINSLAFEGLPPFSVLLLLIISLRHQLDANALQQCLGEFRRTDSDKFTTELSRELLRLSSIQCELVESEETNRRELTPAKTAEILHFFLCQNDYTLPTQNSWTILRKLRNLEFSSKTAPAIQVHELSMTAWTEDCLRQLIKFLNSLDGPLSQYLQSTQKETIRDHESLRDLRKQLFDQWCLSEHGQLQATMSRRLKLSLLGSLQQLNARQQTLSVEQNTVEPDLSSLTRKGTFDRLLLSEHAYDMEYLAARVVNSEALYLAVDNQSQSQLRPLHLLVDCRMQSWGLARALILSSALTIATETDSSLSLIAKSGLETIPLESDKDIQTFFQLQTLAPDIRVISQALTDSPVNNSKQHTIQGRLREKPALRVLLSSQAAATPQLLQSLLAESDLDSSESIVWVAVSCDEVKREACLLLREINARSTRVVDRLVLKYDDLIASRKPTVGEVVEPDTNEELPQFFKVSPCPLRIPDDRVRNVCCLPKALMLEGYVSLSSDRRVLLWSDRSKGPEQLADQLPGSPLISMQFNEDHDLMLVFGSQHSKLEVFVISLETREIRKLEVLIAWKAMLNLVYKDSRFFLIFRNNEVVVINLHSGNCSNPIKVPEKYKRLNGRFYLKDGQLYALDFDKNRVVFEAIAVGRKVTTNCRVIEQSDSDTLFFWDASRHELVNLKTETDPLFLPSESPISLVGGTQCMTKVLFQAKAHEHFVVSLDSWTYREAKSRGALYEFTKEWRRMAIRKKLDCIFLMGLQQFMLLTNNGQKLKFKHIDKQIRLSPVHLRRSVSKSEMFAFPMSSNMTGKRSYQLLPRLLHGGPRVVFDRRGLLHLSHTNVPEFEASIVLTSPNLAIWFSDNEYFGPDYFVHGEKTQNSVRKIDSETAFARLQRLLEIELS